MAKRWPFRGPVPTGSIVGMQMMGHMLLSRGLWRSAGTAANTARLLPPAPVLSVTAALPALIDDVLFYTMLASVSVVCTMTICVVDQPVSARCTPPGDDDGAAAPRGMALARGWGARSSALFLGALTLAVLRDFTRLMPYTYTSAFVLAAVAVSQDGSPTRLVDHVGRLVLSATWLWSGLLKLNPRLLASDFSSVVVPLVDGALGTGTFSEHSAEFGTAIASMELACGLVLVLDAVVLAWRGGCSVDETAASRLRGAATLAGFAMAVMHAVLCVRLSYMGYNMVVLPWNMAYGVLALQLQVFPVPGIRGFRHELWGLGGTIVYVATAVLLVLTPAACLHGMWPSYLSHSLYTGNYDTLFITLHPPLARAFHDVATRHPGCMQTVHDTHGGIPRYSAYAPQNDAPAILKLSIGCWTLSETQTPDYHDPWVFRTWAAQLCAQVEDGAGEVDFTVHPRLVFPYNQQAPAPIIFGCNEALAADPIPGCEPPLAVALAALVAVAAIVATVWLQPGSSRSAHMKRR